MSYDAAFMSYTSNMNWRSAQIITKLLSDTLHPSSVVDFGCAQGAWLKAWQETGAETIQGLDGSYVNQETLFIGAENFQPHDLGKAVDLGRTFDLAQCVEVAEHLPESSASILVDSLTRHADVILFSAAPPGQGGHGHINEQPYSYWRDQFAKKDYVMLDWLRPQLANKQEIQSWYRYNIFLLVKKERMGSLPAELSTTAVPADATVPDISPTFYKVRKQVVRTLPPFLQNIISSILAKF